MNQRGFSKYSDGKFPPQPVPPVHRQPYFKFDTRLPPPPPYLNRPFPKDVSVRFPNFGSPYRNEFSTAPTQQERCPMYVSGTMTSSGIGQVSRTVVYDHPPPLLLNRPLIAPTPQFVFNCNHEHQSAMAGPMERSCSLLPTYAAQGSFLNTNRESKAFLKLESGNDGSNTEYNKDNILKITEKKFMDFLNTKRILKKAKVNVDSFSISQVKKYLQHIATKLEELKQLTDGKDDDSLTQEDLIKVQYIKSEIAKLKDHLERKNLLSRTKKRLEKIRKKRERLKRKRLEQYQQKQEEVRRRKRIHDEIDKWQQNIEKEVQAKKRELELKAVADETLAEVRLKINEAKRSLELLQALEKYRTVKKESASRKGKITTQLSDTLFTERFDEMRNLMTKQLHTYEAEKKTLKVILETEQGPVDKTEESKSADKEKELLHKMKQYLFGERGDPSSDDPVFPVYKFYTTADDSFETFLQIRSQWDSFLVTDDSRAGSSVPCGWVRPSPPSDDRWAKLLKK